MIMQNQITRNIKDVILGAISGGLAAFITGILLNYFLFVIGSATLFIAYPDHLFLQKVIKPLIEKHAFFLSTLDYYYDHFITSIGTAQLALEFGLFNWSINLGQGAFNLILYFPFLSTLLTPAFALVVGGWIAGRIMGKGTEKWHSLAGLAISIPYTTLLWYGRHYITAKSKEFSVTFAALFHVMPSFQTSPVEWQIWTWGIILGSLFGFIGGYLSGKKFSLSSFSTIWQVLFLAKRGFLITAAFVVLFGLIVAFTEAWQEHGKWFLIVILLMIAAIVLFLRKKWVTWAALIFLILSFFGLTLSYLYLAHGVKFRSVLKWQERSPQEGKIQLSLFEGYPSFYSIKELFSLKGFFALSELAKGLRQGFIQNKPFPWYWKLLALIPFCVLCWHGYLLGKILPQKSFYLGWIALFSLWYTLFLLLFLPFSENRFDFSGKMWGLGVKLYFVFAPQGWQVMIQGFLLAFFATGSGCCIEKLIRHNKL